jgi:erythromycin esterase
VRPALLYACLALACSNPDPRRVDWLRSAAVPVRSLALADDDFSDLEALGRAMQGARLVLLGEQSHGDGASFLAKGRLIRYLHERMGFDLLVWEAGFFECRQMDEALRRGARFVEAPRCLFPLWSQSRQVQPLLDYLVKRAVGPRPLVTAGADPQITGPEVAARFPDLVARIIDMVDPSLWPEERRRRLGASLAALAHRGRGAPPAEMDAVAEELARADAALESARLAGRAPPDLDFARRTIDNWRGYGQILKLMGPGTAPPASDPIWWKLGHWRDKLMAENVQWLTDRAPGRKAVVWAANSHILRNGNRIASSDYHAQVRVMGDLLHQAYGPALYSIALAAYRGRYGQLDPVGYELAPAPRTSLESHLHAAGFTLAFLDLRQGRMAAPWLGEPMTATPLGYQPYQAPWADLFDALFFVDEMTPSQPL